MLVYTGSVTVPLQNPTVPVVITLDTPVPVGQSWPRITHTSSWTQGHPSVTPAIKLTGESGGNYTQIQLEWGGTYNQAVTINWQVITGVEFTVQSGSASITGLTSTAAITAIDQSNTFISMSFTPNVRVNYPGAYRARAYFSADDQITFARKYADPEGDPVYIYWYAVTMADATVISGNTTVAYNATYANATVPEVNLNKSLLIFSYAEHTDHYARYACLEGRFASATQLEFRRNTAQTGSSFSLTASWFVVTHDKLNVQYGQTTISTDTPVTETITAVDTEKSLVLVSARNTDGGDTDSHTISVAGELTNSTTLSLLQLASVGTTTASWFIAEWIAAAPPTGLKPTTPIMPDEPNTFSWTPPDNVTPVAYEIERREIGGTWTSTGKIVSTYDMHVFPANAFVIGKDYEWRVRYWTEGEPDPSDYALPVQINTYDPVIQNPIPSPGSSVRVDIRDFGGRLKSPYGRDIQLTIEIANTPDFTSPVTYTMPPVESGEEAIMQHAIQEGGTWYVRLTATDTEELQTVLEYSFFAGQFIQFIEMPIIQLEPQQATHVAVKVRGTATEYTAVVDPVPSPDKVVERLFYIQAGTTTTCQAVAEAFLAKLGRPQVRVSGVIPLTVTLRFGQKVRVKIPDAGIDEEMVLQRKEHRINEQEAATHVVLGDIIVSDNELLARILERGV